MLLSRDILEGQSGGRYDIKVASNQQEVESAFRLRYEVFKLELRRGFSFQDGLDFDEFDEQFHHLIIKHKADDEVIGTYRLQSHEQAMENRGFYSGIRFNMDQFPDHVLENGVEVGRACIKEDHRSGRVLFLLWKGLAAYLRYFEKRYLFGSSGITSTDPSVGIATRKYLEEKGYFHPEYDIEVRKPYRVFSSGEQTSRQKVRIPKLFQNYLDVGSKVCGGPALDEASETIHFLTLLDIEDISEKTRRMFFG